MQLVNLKLTSCFNFRMINSDGEQVRSNIPSEFCKATKEELRDAGKNVLEDCPICDRRGVTCEVGCHPSTNTGISVVILYSFISFLCSPSSLYRWYSLWLVLKL